MKKVLLLILNSLFLILNIVAQNVPQKFNYQGVARLANGDLIANTNILVRFSLIPFASTETADYVETHSVQTNAFGLFNVQIGGGTVVTGTSISDLSWDDSRFIKIELDADGNANGVNYTDLGTLPLLSVPYAKSADVAYDLALPYSKEVSTGTITLPSVSITDNLSAFVPHEVAAVKISTTQDRPALSLYSTLSKGLEATSDSYYGGTIRNATNAQYPALLVEKGGILTNASDVLQVIGNSGGTKSQVLLVETEADYARLSLSSSYLTTGTTDLWTLSGKTDSQTPANARFHVYKSGTGNILSATGSGNVGIGSSDPTSKLEVAGQVKITGGSPGNGKVLTSDANGLASWQTISGTGFVLPFDQTYNNSNTSAFIVRNNDGNAISGISLDGNGVLGQSSTNYGVDGFSSSNAGISGRSQTGIGGRFISQSGPALVTAGGNVGLGTSNPTAQLEVAGQVKITGGSPGSGKVLTSDANGLATWETAGGLTLPYSGSAYSAQGYAAFEVNATGTGQGGVAISGVNESSPLGVGVRGFDNNQTGPGGNGVYGFSYSGSGGYFNSTVGYALTTGFGNVGIGTPTPTAKLEIAGQVKITGGSPGNGKVLTSDANGLATWQTPSGGGGGGYWTANGLDIYNSNQDNVGIGTTTPYAKLHVEGTGYFNTTTTVGVRIDNSGIGNVALDINSTGPAITADGLFGIDATGTNTGVIGTSTAQNDGVGVSGIAECQTCEALRATSEYGTALFVSKGSVVDNGGRWSRRYDVNGPTITEINIIEASNANDMVYVQPVGAISLAGATNHQLTWNGGNWVLTCPTCPGTFFDDALQFNIMVIHYNN